MRINVPITHLRKEKKSFFNQFKDPLQESQLIYNESVNVIEYEKEWSYIEAAEQPYYDPFLGWIGYRGWVKTTDLVKNQAKKRDVVIINK